MKTKFKLPAILFLFAGMLVCTSKLSAQTTIFNTGFFGPPHDEIRSQLRVEELLGGIGGSPIPNPYYLYGFGLNSYFTSSKVPSFMFDVYCNPDSNTLKDINISCLYCSPVNSVGYRIDSNYVIWTNGDITSLYSGVGAGFGYSNSLSSPNYHNTFAGYEADAAFAGTGAEENTAFGYLALTANVGSGTSYGTKNVAVGAYALTSLTSTVNANGVGSSNTAVGWSALKSFNPPTAAYDAANTAVGSRALMNTTYGLRNTSEGYGSSENNLTANDNVAIGHAALTTNYRGSGNVAVGSYCLTNDTVANNTGVGYEALEFTTKGSNNMASGYEAMLNNKTGFSNSATGNVVMFNNVTGTMNVADGSSALFSNKNGDSNVAIGNGALYYDTVSCETGTGNRALNNFTKGKYNTVGDFALEIT